MQAEEQVEAESVVMRSQVLVMGVVKKELLAL